MSFTAYVDESESDRREDPGVYVLAAALLDDAQLETTRETVHGWKPNGHRKLHWHSEGALRRSELSRAVAGLEALHLVVVRAGGLSHERSERRRRLCFERLLYELEQAKVERVVCEARERRQNDSDRKLLDGLRARKLVAGNIRMEHVAGPAEGLLAVPDIVCGAVVAARRGTGEHMRRLDALITMHLIDAGERP